MATTQKKPTVIDTQKNKFNKAFEEANPPIAIKSKFKIIQEENRTKVKFLDNTDDSKYNDIPFNPRDYTEDLGINLKNLFFDILEMLSKGINPIPYVMNSPGKQFTFGVLILGIGILLMFFSNMMI
jgi:hypothetical protein